MAKRKENQAAHPLDPLFKSSLRTMSPGKFNTLEATLSRSQEVPKPWLWPDPQTGLTWTLLGRMAHSIWHAPHDRSPTSFTVAIQLIQDAKNHGQLWHESVPGQPDIVMMWLASARHGAAHMTMRAALRAALRDTDPGLGAPGDGGYIDRAISIIEEEVHRTKDSRRLKTIGLFVINRWLNSTLGGAGEGMAHWNNAVYNPLPSPLPVAAHERIIRLQHQVCLETPVIFRQGTGGAIAKQISNQHIPESFLGAVADILLNPQIKAGSSDGAFVVLEHLLTRGFLMPARLWEALSNGEIAMPDVPILKTQIEQNLIGRATTHSAAAPRPRF